VRFPYRYRGYDCPEAEADPALETRR